MANENSNVVHHHVAKVIISKELQSYRPDDDKPDVVMPAVDCRIITVNGEIWDHKFMVFGLTEAAIVKHWDQHYNDSWKRFDPNKKDETS